jgi:hypothetical protein
VSKAKALTHSNCLTSCIIRMSEIVVCIHVDGRCIEATGYEVHRSDWIDATASSQLCILVTVKGRCGDWCEWMEVWTLLSLHVVCTLM